MDVEIIDENESPIRKQQVIFFYFYLNPKIPNSHSLLLETKAAHLVRYEKQVYSQE